MSLDINEQGGRKFCVYLSTERLGRWAPTWSWHSIHTNAGLGMCGPVIQKEEECQKIQLFEGRWPWTWNTEMTSRKKDFSGSEHPSLGLFFPVKWSYKQTGANPREFSEMCFDLWRSSTDPPCPRAESERNMEQQWDYRAGHQLRNETLTNPNKALCGQTQDSLGRSP